MSDKKFAEAKEPSLCLSLHTLGGLTVNPETGGGRDWIK